MGHIWVEPSIRWDRKVKVRMLVDTGATYSVLPPVVARKVGLGSAGRHTTTIVLADGRRRRAGIATAIFDLLGRSAPATVLVAKVDEPLLGSETLEALGLAADPPTGKLRPTRGFTIRAGLLPMNGRKRP